MLLDETYLYTTRVLSSVRTRGDPLAIIRLRHANSKILEHTTKELIVRQLDGINPNIVAQFHHNELILLVTRTKHVPVLLGS